jgi:glycosyltransferase involved in cell wall biosynthesis
VISVITPAFNEAATLGRLYERLDAVMSAAGTDWQWIVVDDHSRDDTFDVMRALAARDRRVVGIRLARNSGSHAAITCGLHHASGAAAIMLAADLQDPPETIGSMIARWQAGAQVVWAVRRERPGGRTHAGFAAIYYWVMRTIVGMKEMPARGADFFLIDRVVLDAFRRFPERNVSVLALIMWLGFRQESVEYDKQSRHAGQSGWTVARKIKLVVDSIVGFSDLPIRLCSYTGMALLLIAAASAAAAAAGAFAGDTAMAIVLTVTLGLAGMQMLALGIVGEYVWRAFDEARHRPPYIVEATAGIVDPRIVDTP